MTASQDRAAATLPRCWFCGEPEALAISEIWSDHSFHLEACCPGLYEQVVTGMAADPVWARDLLRRLGAEDLTGHRLRRLYDDAGNPPVLDFQLEVRPVTFGTMVEFVRRHHAHCRPPVAWRYGAAIYNGRTLMGVVSVGNPVARAYLPRGWVEVNRLCVRRDMAPQLAWNCCSMLYGAAAREARRRGFRKILTYIRADEDGTSLKAAGWTCEGRAGGGSWNSRRRRRNTDNAFVSRLRWSRQVMPEPRRGSPSVPEGNGSAMLLWLGDWSDAA